jgi:hypothetical protein
MNLYSTFFRILNTSKTKKVGDSPCPHMRFFVAHCSRENVPLNKKKKQGQGGGCNSGFLSR